MNFDDKSLQNYPTIIVILSVYADYNIEIGVVGGLR